MQMHFLCGQLRVTKRAHGEHLLVKTQTGFHSYNQIVYKKRRFILTQYEYFLHGTVFAIEIPF